MHSIDRQAKSGVTSASYYAVLLVLAEVVSLALCFWATTKPWYLDHNNYSQFRTTGYGSRVHQSSCEVLLYGDSTALAGLDPGVITARTGLTACNISETRPVEDFEGVNLPLDNYLAHNPKPQILLTAWTPNDLDLERRPQFSSTPDGLLYALQYDRRASLYKEMLRHPSKTLNFLLWAQAAFFKDTLKRLAGSGQGKQVDDRLLRTESRGLWRYPNPPQTTCVTKPPYHVSSYGESAASVASFRARYERAGIRVLIDTSPVSDCDPDLASYRQLAAGLSDNPLEVLPANDFNVENIHLMPAASVHFSLEVSDQILALMNTRNLMQDGRPKR